MPAPQYFLREYPLQQGALEIAYIEEFFNDFPKRKTATEILARLQDRECQILMAEAPLEDGTVVPVSYKVSHELHEHETDPALADRGAAQGIGGVQRAACALQLARRHPA